MVKNHVLPIILATIWISLSEFFRNEFLLKSIWVNHYASLGLTFPSDPINGLIWGIWSLGFAIFIYFVSKKFSLLGTTFLSWFVSFVLMWIVLGNMRVLPINILPYAIPLSLLETFVGCSIIKKMTHTF
jgi:hypothetical protein